MMQEGRSHRWVFSFLLAFFLFSITVSAQSYPPLVTESQAQSMLNNEIPVLVDALEALPQGSPAYELAERKLSLYQHTWEELNTGRDLAAALTGAFSEFSKDTSGNSMSQDELPGLSKNGPDYGDPLFDNLVEFLAL